MTKTRTMSAVRVMHPTPAQTLVSLRIGGDEYRVTYRRGSNWVSWGHSTDKRRSYRVWCAPGSLEPVACSCPAKTQRCKHMDATAALKEYL